MITKWYCPVLKKEIAVHSGIMHPMYGFICDCGCWFNPVSNKTYRYVQDYYLPNGMSKQNKDGSFKYDSFKDMIKVERRYAYQHKKIEEKNNRIGEKQK